MANRLLAAFPEESLVFLQQDLKELSLGQGTVLFEPGDEVEQIYFPHGGMVSLLTTMKEGASVETATIGREGAVGLCRGLGPRRWLTRAVIQVPGVFSVVRGARLEQVVRDSRDVRDILAQYSEIQWAEAQQLSACNAIHDAGSRLARWLLQCADRIGGNNLPLTQEYLAHMLGVRRTTVTLLAQDMQLRGIIKYSRGRILIVDRQSLESGACECYHALQQDRLAASLGLTF